MESSRGLENARARYRNRFCRGLCVASRADVLYTVNGSTLSIVNTATMTAERLGSLGSYRVGGLTIGADGKLFGVSTLAHQLVSIEINPETNKVITTPINTLNKEVTLSTDIACDPLDPAKGLYGVADFDPNTELFSIDTASARPQELRILAPAVSSA